MLNKKNISFATLAAAIFLLFYISYCNYLVFMVVPNEKMMGAVQRIFYFHVGSATASYVSIALLLFGSVFYLATRNKDADLLAHSAAEVGFVLCTIVLASGMIWGHSAWNTWFSWEPRLVSFLLLWLLLLAYNILRVFADPNKVASQAAVLGIISAVNVPVVIYSIKLLPNIAQLHPQVVEKQGLKDPLFVTAMFYCMVAMVVLQFLLVLIRWRIARLENK